MHLTRYLLLLTFILACQATCGQYLKALNLDTKYHEEPEIFTFAELLPRLPGGEAKLDSFLRAKIPFSAYSPAHVLHPQVTIRLVVEKDGCFNPDSITINGQRLDTTRSLHKTIFPILRDMPRWRPASQGGRFLRAYALLPLPMDTTHPNNDTIIFSFTERMPSFPGGDEALNKFLIKNLRLPDKDTRYSARLMFMVQRDGKIRPQSITIDGRTPDTSNAMDKALLQMIAKMPLWIPAKQGGHAVHCYTGIPIACIRPQE